MRAVMCAVRTFVLIGALALIIFPRSSMAQFNTPEETVKTLYGAYRQGDNQKPGNSAIEDGRIFDKSLAQLFRKATSKRDIPGDFFVGGGDDYYIAKVEIGKVVVTGAKATVSAKLFQDRKAGQNPPPELWSTNFVFFLKKEDGKWKIDDAKDKSGDTYRKWLRTNR